MVTLPSWRSQESGSQSLHPSTHQPLQVGLQIEQKYICKCQTASAGFIVYKTYENAWALLTLSWEEVVPKKNFQHKNLSYDSFLTRKLPDLQYMQSTNKHIGLKINFMKLYVQYMFMLNTSFCRDLTQLTKQLFDLRLLYSDLDSACAIPTIECIDNDLACAWGIRAETHQLPGGVVLQSLKTTHTIDCQFWN